LLALCSLSLRQQHRRRALAPGSRDLRHELAWHSLALRLRPDPTRGEGDSGVLVWY
jgi:hypothetical protein